jgi:CelD/BcsL family acetyltransferase involved in cellulose biosynthesis
MSFGAARERVRAKGVKAVLFPAREAQALEKRWADLAANAVEPNPFYSPALLLPALEAFAGEGVRLAVVEDADDRLIGLLPVEPARGYARLPIRYIAGWIHPHCFFGAPLIRRGMEEEALTALFDVVEDAGAFLRLRALGEGGEVMAAALRAVAATGRLCAVSGRYERALWRADDEAEVYFAATMRAKKRKELRRLHARLEEAAGPVGLETLAEKALLAQWIAEFLALEASGWKGGEGTALASDAASRKFFEDALARAFSAGALLFHRLRAGQNTIAMIVNFIERGEAYSFKIAHDESFARYSPGVMLEIEMMKALERIEGFSFIDSCAARDHPMINSLWRERRAIAAINVSRRDGAAKAAFRVVTALERAGEAARARRVGTRASRNGDGDDDL